MFKCSTLTLSIKDNGFIRSLKPQYLMIKYIKSDNNIIKGKIMVSAAAVILIAAIFSATMTYSFSPPSLANYDGRIRIRSFCTRGIR